MKISRIDLQNDYLCKYQMSCAITTCKIFILDFKDDIMRVDLSLKRKANIVILLLINAVYSFSQEKVNIKGVYEIQTDKESYELSKSDTICFEGMSLRDAIRDKDGIKDESCKHEYVDLGLSSGTLWATTNVGALSPDNYGAFFAWGETQTKEVYSGINYKFGTGDEYGDDSLFKYNTLLEYGKVDGLMNLLSEDDIATIEWGKDWRTPTISEWAELYEQCRRIWSDFNGAWGYKVIGINNNWIFLPIGGCRSQNYTNSENYGCYWSATVCSEAPDFAHYMLFYSKRIYDFYYDSRYLGMPIRPVISKIKDISRMVITPPEPWKSLMEKQK